MAAPRTRTTVNDCDCASFTRPHGTQHNYQVHRCGCTPCRVAYQRYLVDLAAAGPAYVDARPVAARLHTLSAQGVTIRELADRIGYSSSALYSVSRLARPRCRRELAADVLAVPARAVAA